MNESREVGSQISIIVPTYNESQNILNILKSIKDNLPKNISAQTIIVDDNSPDGTGKIVEDYLKNLKKITFNFKKGKIYSLMGPSGSGKSTLLNLLSLIDRPNSGSIFCS